MREVAEPTPSALRLLGELHDRHRLSARGHTRVLRVARTVADLDGSDASAPSTSTSPPACGSSSTALTAGGRAAMTRMTACDDCLRRTDLIAALAGLARRRVAPPDAPGRVLALPRRSAARRRARARRCGARYDAVRRRRRARRGRATPGSTRSAAATTRIRSGCATSPIRRPCCTSPATAALRRRSTDARRRRRRAPGVAVRARRRPRRSAAGSSAAGVPRRLRARARASTRPPTPARSRAPRRPSPCWPAAPTGPYPAVQAAAARGGRGRAAPSSPRCRPGFGIHRWAFVARNRLIAALAQVVVVVEATERSGSLTTADLGAELGRAVAAVPGRVTCARRGRHERPDPRRRAAGPRRPRRARRARRAHRRALRAVGRRPAATLEPELAAAARRDRRGPLDAADARRARARAARGARRPRASSRRSASSAAASAGATSAFP